MNVAKQTHNHVEGDPVTRFFRNATNNFFSLFSSQSAEPQYHYEGNTEYTM